MDTLKLVFSGLASLALLAQALLLFREALYPKLGKDGGLGAAQPDAQEIAVDRRTLCFAGALALALASMTGLESYAGATHVIVSAPALGLLLWEGESSWVVRSILVLFAVALALVTPSMRVVHARGRLRSSFSGYAFMLALLALAAFAQWEAIIPMGTAQSADAQVYGLCLFAPSVLLLLVAAVVECVLVDAGQRRFSRRFATNAGVCCGVSLFALLAGQDARDTLTRLAHAASAAPDLETHWGGAALISGALALLFGLRILTATPPNAQSYSSPPPRGDDYESPDPPRLEVGTAFVSSVACVALAHLDLAYLGCLPPWLAIGVSGWAAAVWVESVTGAPLLTAGDGLCNVVMNPKSSLRRVFVRLRATGARLVRSLVDVIDGKGQSKVRVYLTRLTLAYLAISVLWLGAMYPSRGQMVVNVFLSEQAGGQPLLGIQASEHVRAHIASFVDLLCVETKSWYVPGKEVDDRLARCNLPRVLADQGGMGIAKDVLAFGPLNVPGELVMRAFGWTRWLLWTREITGTVVLEQGGTYRLFAHANECSPFGMGQFLSESGSSLGDVSERIAFSVLSSESAWRGAGLTQDFDAFKLFTQGLGSLRGYESSDRSSPAPLEEAADALRLAIARDRDFAAARYYLAQVLIYDEQFDTALHELEVAAQNPGFRDTAGDAIAKLHWQRPSYTRPGVVSQSGWSMGDSREARRRWERIRVSAAPNTPAWASAYRGLCEVLAYGGADDEQGARIAGYYYCERGARLYRAMLDQRNSEALAAYVSIAQAQALAVVHLGRPSAPPRDHTTAPPREKRDALRILPRAPLAQYAAGMSCDSDEFQPNKHARTDGSWARLSSRGYAHALSILNEARKVERHDVTLACLHAKFAEAVYQPEPMAVLLMSDAGRSYLCKRMSERARHGGEEDERPALHAAALRSCQAALELNPANADAALQIAHNYRIQRVQQKMAEVPVSGLKPSRPTSLMALRQASDSLTHAIHVRRFESEEVRLALSAALVDALLIEGRHAEAIARLDPLVGNLQMRSATSELFGSLAEAHLCAAGNQSNEAQQTAERHLAMLKLFETSREDRPFTRESALDTEAMRARCMDREKFGYFAAAR